MKGITYVRNHILEYHYEATKEDFEILGRCTNSNWLLEVKESLFKKEKKNRWVKIFTLRNICYSHGYFRRISTFLAFWYYFVDDRGSSPQNLETTISLLCWIENLCCYCFSYNIFAWFIIIKNYDYDKIIMISWINSFLAHLVQEHGALIWSYPVFCEKSNWCETQLNIGQKQPPRGVPNKRCSENMLQV